MKLVTKDATEPNLTYKEHPVAISRVGKGWRAMIYPPGSSIALLESPARLEECRQEQVIAEAKWIVDARCTTTFVPY